MTSTITWSGTITAVSSVAHGGETRGTITLLRRELILLPGGQVVHVPLISGNSFRGVLRRIGEEMLRDVLGYEGRLPLSAAHALRGGGALAKVSGEPFSGQRLQRLRSLVPHVGVFGCAGGGRIIDGCLQVGKVMPHVAECAHLFPVPPSAPTAFAATQVETYVRQDDATGHDFAGVVAPVPTTEAGLPDLDSLLAPEPPDADTMLMMYRIETFPAGTVFSTWLRLTRATALEVAFFADVLARFQCDGRLGGRAAIGHGRIRAELVPVPVPVAGPPQPLPDWRAFLAARRDEATEALQGLT
jgi:hypothetical protein